MFVSNSKSEWQLLQTSSILLNQSFTEELKTFQANRKDQIRHQGEDRTCCVSVTRQDIWKRTDEGRLLPATQTERRRGKTQCQTILLHTSVKLGFNGHIITFLSVKLEPFQPNQLAARIYFKARDHLQL